MAVVVALLLGVAAADVQAQQARAFYWLRSGGGDFHDWTHWALVPEPTGGAGSGQFSSEAPGNGDDTNIFDRGVLPANRYDASFVGGVTADDGGTWANDRLIIANDSLSLNFTGPAAWLNPTAALSEADLPSMTVGRDAGDVGDLRLRRLEPAGTLTTRDAVLGWDIGSIGRVNIDDFHWTLTGSGRLVVGQRGTGELTLQNGASVTSGFGYLGYAPGSTGHATLTGAGSSWTADTLHVGHSGTGTLDVLNGATITSERGLLGVAPGGSGAVTLTGAGSQWTTEFLEVGFQGTGTINVLGGATLTTNRTTNLGSGPVGSTASAAGTVRVAGNGSAWNAGSIRLGALPNTQGTLAIEGGTADVGSIFAGINGAATGTINVTGPGSTLSSNAWLVLGDGGRATLNVANGAVVDFDTTFPLIDTSITLGNAAGSEGDATVTGAGSMLNAGLNMTVGESGTGTLQVNDGATVEVGQNLRLGRNAGAGGTVRLDGGSMTVGGDLTVGDAGAGTLDLRNGGALTVAGTLTANGTSSIVLEDALLDAAALGPTAGQLLDWRSGTVRLEALTLADGQPLGPALTLADDRTLEVGDLTLADANGGTPATLTLDPGGTARAADSVTAGADSRIDLRGGRLEIPELNPGVQAALNWQAGTLRLPALRLDAGQPLGSSVTLADNRTLEVGTLELGPPGTLTINPTGTTRVTNAITADDGASIQLAGGTLAIPGFGAGAFDAFTWQSGTLQLPTVTFGDDQPFGASFTVRADRTLDVVNAVFQDPGTLTIDPGGTLRVRAGRIENEPFAVADAAVVNRGLVVFDGPGTAERSNSSFCLIGCSPLGGDILLSTVTNEGTLAAINGADLVFDGFASTVFSLVGQMTFTTTADSVLLADDADMDIGNVNHGDAWTNRGTLRVRNGGTITLGGDFSLADTTVLDNQGGTIRIVGNWDHTGRTLTLDSATGDLVLDSEFRGDNRDGTIRGGTVVQTQGAGLRFAGGNVTLDGVTLTGDLVFDRPNARLNLLNDTTWTGDLRLEAVSIRVLAEQDVTIDDQVLGFNHEANYLDVTGTLTVAPDAEVRLNAPRFAGSDSTIEIRADALVNRGAIIAANPDDPTTRYRGVSTDTLANEGLIAARDGTSLELRGDVRLAGGSLEVLDGSEIRVNRLVGTNITEFRAEGTGRLHIEDTWNLDGGTLDPNAFPSDALSFEPSVRLTNGRLLGEGSEKIYSRLTDGLIVRNLVLVGDHTYSNSGLLRPEYALRGEKDASLTLFTLGIEAFSQELELTNLQINTGTSSFILVPDVGHTKLTFGQGAVVNQARDDFFQISADEVVVGEGGRLNLRHEGTILSFDTVIEGTVAGGGPLSDGDPFVTNETLIQALESFELSGELIARGEGNAVTILGGDPGDQTRDPGPMTIRNRAGATYRAEDGAFFEIETIGPDPLKDTGGAFVLPEQTWIGGEGGLISRFTMPVKVGGVLEPGLSPGTFTFDTADGQPLPDMLTLLDTAETRIDIAGTADGAFDVIQLIDGGVVLDGRLAISLLDGFRPDAEDVFDILITDLDDPTDAIVGMFANVDADGRVDLVNAFGSFEVRSLDDRVRLSNFVPEPGTLGLLMLGSFACLRRPRRAPAAAA